MTAAKVMDIISRLPGCDGQAADAVSAETKVKMEDAPKLLKLLSNGVAKAGCQQAAADSQGSRTCVCASTLLVIGSGTCRERRMK